MRLCVRYGGQLLAGFAGDGERREQPAGETDEVGQHLDLLLHERPDSAVRRSCSSPGGSGAKLADLDRFAESDLALLGELPQRRRLPVETDPLEVGAHPGGELVAGQGAHKAPVHPAQLLGVEDAGAGAQALDVEVGDQVGEASR